MKHLIPVLFFFLVLYFLPSGTNTFSPAAEKTITVSVQGALKKDVILRLPVYATVNDALDKVELEENADLSSVNRLTVLKDGDVIVIPKNGSAGKVSINTGTKEELMRVNGIGEGKAEAIIAYREEHGLFQCLEDLMKIKGIKEKTFEKLKDSLCL
ncbi:MAG: helix-hairpin-helix domain-containing protein [Erysipelotrichales bacterium]|nr:helix-hairpin-helix domain-containing protein [Erysipelotrichales bacterium]